MMINKRLIGTISESKKYVAGNVIFQWCSLAVSSSPVRLACVRRTADMVYSVEHGRMS